MDIHWGYCAMDPCTCRAERMTAKALGARVEILEASMARLLRREELFDSAKAWGNMLGETLQPKMTSLEAKEFKNCMLCGVPFGEAQGRLSCRECVPG